MIGDAERDREERHRRPRGEDVHGDGRMADRLRRDARAVGGPEERGQEHDERERRDERADRGELVVPLQERGTRR